MPLAKTYRHVGAAMQRAGFVKEKKCPVFRRFSSGRSILLLNPLLLNKLLLCSCALLKITSYCSFFTGELVDATLRPRYIQRWRDCRFFRIAAVIEGRPENS